MLADKDSTDWSRPGVNEIVLRSIPTGGAGAIIELHDGGGDRSQTVAALSTLIRLLKLQGYQFDTMSDLARLDAHRLMPAVGFFERTWGRAFLATMNIAGTLSWWFLALAFGVALLTMIRLLLLVGVVSWRSRWTRNVLGPVPPQLPPMSVIVAAYNEAGSIRHVGGIEFCAQWATPDHRGR